MTLRSADPRDAAASTSATSRKAATRQGEDLDSVVAGIKLVRRINAELRQAGLIADEERPGEHVQSDARAARLRPRPRLGPPRVLLVRRSGRGSGGGVLTSDFRVHGTHGLRVVDASVFPRIPGFFPVSAIYMVAEKAADDILGAADR